jgi:hypothetical protein
MAMANPDRALRVHMRPHTPRRERRALTTIAQLTESQAVMSPRFSLDVPLKTSGRLVSAIKNARSMIVFGANGQIEISIDMFQVLMSFSETTTARQAFHIMDVNVELEEFGAIVEDLCRHGLLGRQDAGDDDTDLQHVLDPRLSDAAHRTEITSWLRDGRAIIIPDALPAPFAEEVHGELLRLTRWTVAEGGHDFFQYRNCIVDRLEERGAALMKCSRLFSSAATRRFVTELAGTDCAGDAEVTASWYRPGEYAMPHDDATAGRSRSVAFIWYLTKDWRREWGGALFWCPTGQYISPGFNVLVMFRVTPSNMHLVSPVALGAVARRLTINGFWYHPDRDAQAAPPAPDRSISPRAYGREPPAMSDALPIVVL